MSSKTMSRILLVDDNPVNRALLVKLLQSQPEGFLCIEAENGLEALQYLEETNVDLVLLDLVMPEMDGIECCQRIRKRFQIAELPVLIFTADNELEVRVQGLEAGASDFVSRPIQAEELLYRVRKHLDLTSYHRAKQDETQELTPNALLLQEAQREVEGQSKLLLVDDNPVNRKVLLGFLGSQNKFSCRQAESGEEALRLLEQTRPDLLLLDLVMPGIDGIEVCRRVRKDFSAQELPILILTAEDEVDERIRGLEAGANDFISRPIHAEELLARVQNQLHTSRLQKHLLRQARELGERNEQLQRQEQLRQQLMEMIVHDLKSPVTALMLSMQTIAKVARSREDRLLRRLADSGLGGLRQLDQLTYELTRLSQLERGEVQFNLQDLDLKALCQDTLNSYQSLAEKNQIQLSFGLTGNPELLFSDPTAIQRVLANLLTNAMRYTARDSSVTLALDFSHSLVQMEILDQGPGIPEEFLNQIFDRYFQVEMMEKGTKLNQGIGLAFCKLTVEGLGGTIEAFNRESGGAGFRICLPRSSVQSPTSES